jgi:hypothetical protein
MRAALANRSSAPYSSATATDFAAARDYGIDI